MREALREARSACERDGINYTYIATEDGGEEEMILAANRCGLLRLAEIIVDLAEKEPGSHQHFDDASNECWKGLNIFHVEDPW